MKRLQTKRWFTFCLVLGTFSTLSADAYARAAAETPVINVIYPKDSQLIALVDSTFILGSVTPPGATLTINGVPISVYETGGFLAYLPVSAGEFTFQLVATDDNGADSLAVSVQIGPLAEPVSDSGIAILAESVRPLWDRTVRSGDEISVRATGTSGGAASFRILFPRDTSRWFPMVALEDARIGAYHEFREQLKSLTDSLPLYHEQKSLRVYHGIWLVPDRTNGVVDDTLRVEIALRSVVDSSDSTVTVIAPGRLIPIDTDSPRVAELTDSVQILRMGPRLGYWTIFQPYGVRARWWGTVGPWTILRPAPGYEAWVETAKIRLLPEGTPLPGSRIARLSTVSTPRSVQLHVGTSERLPYKVTVSDDLQTVRLLIFGATSNTDWIDQDPEDDLIDRVSWIQTRPQVYEIELRLHQPLWGYDAHYNGNRLILEIRRPPVVRRALQGLTIAVDAGHSPDPGAIGPTGLMEKDANISIVRKVKHYLERKGARVILTRRGHEDVALYDRPGIAVAHDVDLFISVHNNAVPDGVNPYINNGTGTYYYHPFSRDLARHVQRWTRDATGLPDYGLKHGNFAVIRPTQYPSVLVECAFIILPEQEALLLSPESVARIARGIANGIANFVRERLGR